MLSMFYRFVSFGLLFILGGVSLVAQQVDTLQIKTSAKENPTATFRCRVPAQYDQSSNVKYRLLVYFGGRNTTGKHVVKEMTDKGISVDSITG